jgi:hypothetical protein
MKTLLSIIVFFFFGLTTFTQSYNDLIILRSGDSLFCNIKSLEGNSLLIESKVGSSVMLRVIKIIKTKNEKIINAVSQLIEGEIFTRQQDYFQLNLTTATIPILTRDETPFIKYKSVSAFFGSQNPLRYGFTLFSEFPSLKNVVACFEGSVGVNEKYLLFRNFNIGIGIGTEYNYDLITAQVFLKYYRMNLAAIKYGTDLSKDFICTDFYFKYHFTQNSNYYLQFCYRFNLNSSELAEEKFQNIFTMGIGLKL